MLTLHRFSTGRQLYDSYTTVLAMQHTDSKDKDSQELLRRIVPIIMENGLKATTMDSVATRLGMSKRTLYEIFHSKSEMIKAVLDANERQAQEFISEVFSRYDNVLEALVEVFKYNRDLMGRMSVSFFHDMDRLYKDRRADYEHSREGRYEKMMEIFRRGVRQGVFRPDVDYSVQIRMMSIQMEGFKRMEEFFPSDITLQRVYDTITLAFLRSIASPKGMGMLDKLTGALQGELKVTD